MLHFAPGAGLVSRICVNTQCDHYICDLECGKDTLVMEKFRISE